MTDAPAAAHVLKNLRQLIERIPAGRLITFGALSSHFKTSPRHIAAMLHGFAGGGGVTLPWHRVVADGGAVGRHRRRDEQIRNLQADGIAVSQGGFVQEFSRVVIADITGPLPPAAAVPAAPLSRSRGMKDRPL